jgi:hypothetical protein
MRKKLAIGIASAVALTAAQAYADTTTTTFGPLPAATFGGTGIPNSSVEVTTVSNATGVVTLGLTATPRFVNPPVGNDGNGNFSAANGATSGTAKWNFDYYVSDTGTSYANDQFELLYDFTPGANTPVTQLGVWNLGTPSTSPFFTAGVAQDSENLSFSFLTTGVPGVVTPPSGGSTTFDPNATGQYTFILEDLTANGQIRAQDEINVNVAPDMASTAMLMLMAAAGLFAFNYRQARLSNN